MPPITESMKREEVIKRQKYQGLCNNVKLRAIQDGEEQKMKFEGYAIVFNQETVLYKSQDGTEYKEIIDKNALANTDMKDVPLRYNHALDWILARTRKKIGPGSLRLSVDDYGLKVEGEFVDMQYSRDVYAMMVAEVVDQMSFAFTVRDYSYNSETHTTTIRDIDKLFDVSVVDNPAYPQTSISAARSAEDAEMEIKAKQEAEALEKAKAEAEKKALELENKRKAELEKLNQRLKTVDIMIKLNK